MAAIYDASSSATVAASATLSWSHTCSGSNGALMVAVGQDNGTIPQKVIGVTYNGVALSSQAVIAGSPGGIQIWYLLNPATGTNTVTVTVSTTQNYAGGTSNVTPPSVTGIAISANGVTGVINHGGTTGVGTASYSVASSANSLVLDGFLEAYPPSITGSKQTQRIYQASSVDSSNLYGSTAAGTGGNVVMGYNATSGNFFVISTIEFTGLPVATGPHPKGRRDLMAGIVYVPGIGLAGL